MPIVIEELDMQVGEAPAAPPAEAAAAAAAPDDQQLLRLLALEAWRAQRLHTD
ncbi:MAG TPA: hypothetical protein VLI06_16435 [Solimonas sp.]|nr:hypothetical protein [Solimonas sp.]